MRRSDVMKVSFWDRTAKIYDHFMKKDHKAYKQMYSLIYPVVRHKQVLELATGTAAISFLSVRLAYQSWWEKEFPQQHRRTYDCIALMSYYTVCKAVTSVAEITKQHDLLEIIPAMCNPDHAACWGESVCENGVSECKEASERMQIGSCGY